MKARELLLILSHRLCFLHLFPPYIASITLPANTKYLMPIKICFNADTKGLDEFYVPGTLQP